MDGAIPTPPSKNTPKLPTPSSPKKLLTYPPTYPSTHLPTYLLPLSLSLKVHVCPQNLSKTDLPTYLFKTTYLTLSTISKSYPPTPPPLTLSHSLSNSNTYLPSESYLPSYLPTYQLWRWSVCGLLKIFWSGSLPLPPRHSLSESLSLCPQETLVLLSRLCLLCVCVCSVSLLWIYYL